MKKLFLGLVLLLVVGLVACTPSEEETSTTTEATTTAKTTKATTTASTTELLEPVDYSESLKILSIGNSFSEDAHAHLWAIANSYGIDEVIVANLYIGGSSL